MKLNQEQLKYFFIKNNLHLTEIHNYQQPDTPVKNVIADGYLNCEDWDIEKIKNCMYVDISDINTLDLHAFQDLISFISITPEIEMMMDEYRDDVHWDSLGDWKIEKYNRYMIRQQKLNKILKRGEH